MSVVAKKIAAGIINYLKLGNKLHLLPEVIDLLAKKAKQFDAANKAYVRSSYKLSLLEKVKIKEALRSVFKKDLKIINMIDPNLIAGLRITVKDKIIDLSMDKTLENLKSKINHD